MAYQNYANCTNTLPWDLYLREHLHGAPSTLIEMALESQADIGHTFSDKDLILFQKEVSFLLANEHFNNTADW